MNFSCFPKIENFSPGGSEIVNQLSSLSSTSYFVLRILKMPSIRKQCKTGWDLSIFSPFANPDNSNFSSFMSPTNDVDLDLIGESGGHTETNGGLIAFTCRDEGGEPVHVGVDGVQTVVIVPWHRIITARHQPVDDWKQSLITHSKHPERLSLYLPMNRVLSAWGRMAARMMRTPVTSIRSLTPWSRIANGGRSENVTTLHYFSECIVCKHIMYHDMDNLTESDAF